MKKHIYLHLLFILTISNNAFADAWTATSSNCNWFSNRYKCHVGIKRQGQVGNHCAYTTANCSGVEELCEYGTIGGGSNPFLITYARAYAIANDTQRYSEEFGGFDGTDQWYAGEDMSYSIPRFAKNFMSYPKSDNSNRSNGATLKLGRIIFDEVNRKIIIYNIRGTIKANPIDVVNDFSAFTIAITHRSTPETIDNTKSYMERRIYFSNAFFNNGKLLLGKDLKGANVNIKKDKAEVEITVEIPYLEVSIPGSVDLSELEVINGVDNGNKGEGISEKYVINDDAKTIIVSEEIIPQEVFEISNYPNPIENNATTVTIKLPESDEIIVELCNFNGKVVDRIFKGEAKKEELLEFHVRTENVSNGIGYIRVTTSKKILLRKIMIAR